METNHFESQKAQLLRDLRKGEKLTAIQILNRYNSMRGAALVYSLKKDGFNIQTTIIKTPSGKRVAQYQLIQEFVQSELFSDTV